MAVECPWVLGIMEALIDLGCALNVVDYQIVALGLDSSLQRSTHLCVVNQHLTMMTKSPE